MGLNHSHVLVLLHLVQQLLQLLHRHLLQFCRQLGHEVCWQLRMCSRQLGCGRRELALEMKRRFVLLQDVLRSLLQ